MTPTHTPAAQPAGEMDDAALSERSAKLIITNPIFLEILSRQGLAIVKVGEMGDAALVEAMVEAIDNMPLGTERHEAISRALAIARPVLQDQARRKALEEAAEIANRLHPEGLFKWQTAHHSEYDRGYDAGIRKQAKFAETAILALKDKPNG